MKLVSQLLFLTLVLLYSINSTAKPQVFNQDSYQNILKSNKDNNFIMILWSLDCPPCIEEMPVISSFHKKNPGVEIILVSTDEVSRVNEITDLLFEAELQGLQQWVFQNENYHRIRYSIDPTWYGELPRSYFYRAGKLNKKRSGRLTMNDLEQWLTRQSAINRGKN